MYTIEWVGTVAIGILLNGQPNMAMALEDGQQVPPEFQVGDEVRIVNHPDPLVAVGIHEPAENQGYYEVTHVRSGRSIRIMHRVYAYMFEKPAQP